MYLRTTLDLDSIAARVIVVPSTGEPYFTCENQWTSLEDLIRLLLHEDEDGNLYIRVTDD